MIKRKVAAIVVVLALIISCLNISFAQGSSEIQTICNNLNKLDLLSCDAKGDYKIKDGLTRVEATVLTTKLLGMNSYVKANKDTLSKTTFTDVKQSDWFAPYVGYCNSQGIITGGKGKFGVKETITEQAFLLIVLKILKYNNENELKWNDNVFKFAYNYGLVADSSYITKTKDDGQIFTRGKAASIIIKALQLKPYQSNYTLVQILVNEGALNGTAAIQTGLIKDSVTTCITNVTAVNSHQITIKFNEAINSIDEKKVTIYEKDTNSNLNVSILAHSGTQLDINTDLLRPERVYYIEIRDAEDMEGNKTSLLKGTCSGYQAVDVKSELFKISKMEQRSKNEIFVYFTHPINENAEDDRIYEILENGQPFEKGEGLNISLLGDKNAVAIKLKNKEFSIDKEYTLKVSGSIISVYGTYLCERAGDSVSFIAKYKMEESLKIDSITTVGGRCIRLDFNRDINPSMALQIYNYSITDTARKPLEIVKVELFENNKSIFIRTKPLIDKNMTYNIVINSMLDITKQYSIDGKQYTFKGDYPNNQNLSIKDIEVVNSGVVKVTFERAIDAATGLNPNNYQVTNMTLSKTVVPSRIKFDSSDQKSVKLFFEDANGLMANTPFILKVSDNLKEFTGEKLSVSIEKTFFVKDVLPVNIKIQDAKIIGEDTVKVTFNKEIFPYDKNVLPSNYYVTYISAGKVYKKVPIAITYIDDNFIVFKFDDLPNDKYTFNFKVLTDYAGNQVTFSVDKSVIVTIEK